MPHDIWDEIVTRKPLTVIPNGNIERERRAAIDILRSIESKLDQLIKILTPEQPKS